MNCPQCGSQVMDGAKFCTTCGAKLQAPVAAAMQQAVYEEPAAPVYEEPAVSASAPVYEEPAVSASAPVYEEPVAPVYEEPAAPAYEAPAAPAYEAPAAPAYEAPVAPAYEEPAVSASAPQYQQPQAYAYQQPQQFQQPQYQQPQQFQQPQYQQPPYQAAPAPAEAPKKKGKAGLIIGIIAGVVALAAIVIVLINVLGKPKAEPVTVNLNDYIEVTFTGISGSGEADVKFNTNKLKGDFETSLVWTCKKKNMPEEPVVDLLCENISVYLDNYYGLSNGDTVTLDIYDFFSDYGELLPDFYANNAVITFENSTVKVEGLEEATTFDPFEGATVTVEGSEGSTWVTLTLRDDLEVMGSLYITTDDDTWALKNGDVIHYYIYGYDEFEQELLSSLYGMYPSVTTWDYTVSGLEREGYITDIADVPVASMTTSLEASAYAYLASEIFSQQDYIDGGVVLTGVKSAGYYFFTPMAGHSPLDQNILYVIMEVSADITKADKSVENFKYYYITRITDLYLNTDGTVTFYENGFDDYGEGFGTGEYPSFEYSWDDLTWTGTGALTVAELTAQIKAVETVDCTYVTNME